MLPNDKHPGPGCSCAECLRKFPDSERSLTPLASKQQGEMLHSLRSIADTIEQNGGWHIAALKVRAAADEIERLTRESAHHLEERLNAGKAMREALDASAVAEEQRDRLRAALEKIAEDEPTFASGPGPTELLARAALNGESMQTERERDQLHAALERARKAILTVDDLLEAAGYAVDSSARSLLMCGCPDAALSGERSYRGTPESFYCPKCNCERCGNTRPADETSEESARAMELYRYIGNMMRADCEPTTWKVLDRFRRFYPPEPLATGPSEKASGDPT